MKPGLHPLLCSHCGGPLDPSGNDEGVVACPHCRRPHLWVAPGRPGGPAGADRPAASAAPAGPPRSTFGREQRPRRVPLSVALALLLLVVGVATGVTALWARRGSASYDAIAVTGDMPLAPGDVVTLRSKSSSTRTVILGLDGSDRALVRLGDLTGRATWVSRSMLTLDWAGGPGFGPVAGDVVLARQGTAWHRREVVGLEPDGVRVRGVWGDAAEFSVPYAALALAKLQSKREPQGQLYANVNGPDVRPGDVVVRLERGVLEHGRVEAATATAVRVEPVLTRGGPELPRKLTPAGRGGQSWPLEGLLAHLVDDQARLEPGDEVLVPGASFNPDQGYQRAVVEAMSGGRRVRVRPIAGPTAPPRDVPLAGLVFVRAAP